jgi:hypothetical protein
VRTAHLVYAFSIGAFLLLPCAAQGSKPDAISSAALQGAPNQEIDPSTLTALTALPLSCIDHPQRADDHPHNYLWVHDEKAHPVEDYATHRAFYGCYDWHSAVNSTWLLVALLKQQPTMFLAPVIRQRLTEHLGKSNIAGEVEFFSYSKAEDSDSKNFERPYGYAWLLKLFGELSSWKDPDGQKLSANLRPLADLMGAKYIAYLKSLPYPIRVGVHPNTALTMNFVLDYTDSVPDPAMRTAVHDAAVRFFGKDVRCPSAYEPSNGDFASPCLAEAMLMSRVMDQQTFVPWLTAFLAPLDSAEFKVYEAEIDTTRVAASGSTADADDKEGLLGSKSHLIGLAFQRAADFLGIASALPKDDPRVLAFRRLAKINAQRGFQKIGDAGYLGQHWLATYAVLYLQAETRHTQP